MQTFIFTQKNPKTMADKVSVITSEQICLLSKSDEEQQKLLILFPNLSVRLRRQKSPTDACDNVHLLPLDWNDWIVENAENETPEMKSLKSGVFESANTKIDVHESCNTEPKLSPSNCPMAFTSSLMPSVTLRVVVKQIMGIGFQLWPAAVVMCRWMESECFNVYGPGFFSGKRVLELGSGCGLVGMFAAYLGAKSVTVTDLPVVVPHLWSNLQINGFLPPSTPPRANTYSVNTDSTDSPKSVDAPLHTDLVVCSLVPQTVDAAALAWGCQHEWDSSQYARNPMFYVDSHDVLLLSDCLYHEHLFTPLLDTLLALTSSSSTTILMCQKHRWLHSEHKFFRRLGQHFVYRVVGELRFQHEQRRFEHIYEIRRKPQNKK